MNLTDGICPNCESKEGEVAQLCCEPLCAKKGFHLVEAGFFGKAKEEARKFQRPVDPFVGRAIDKYVLVGKLGEGGMGAVFVALQKPLMREVALKIISGIEVTETVSARFEREARAISFLDHPNIVKLFDFGVGGFDFQVPYMAIEYVKDGITLDTLWKGIRKTGQQLPFSAVRHVFNQILNALQAAHKIGIVHRDIKPENVMTKEVEGDPYFVKLLDFGLAKAVEEFKGFEAELSQAGAIMGTPYYMAPEQIFADDRHPVDHRADLYAVTVLLYEAILGERPFTGTSLKEILGQKVNVNFNPLDKPVADGLPESLREFMQIGMSHDANVRFESATEMRDALQEVLDGLNTDNFQTSATSYMQALSSEQSQAQLSAMASAAGRSQARARSSTPGGGLSTVGAGSDSGMRAASDVYLQSRAGKRKSKAPVLLGLAVLFIGALALAGALLIPRMLRQPIDTKGGQGAMAVTTPVAADAGEAKAPDASKDSAAEADAAARSKAVKVTFETDPVGAAVSLDGVALGPSPVHVELAAEQIAKPDVARELQITHEGYQTLSKKVTNGDLAKRGSVHYSLARLPESSPEKKPKAKPKTKPKRKPKRKPKPAPKPGGGKEKSNEIEML
jgi:serine/threonine protein kinase